MKLFRLLRQITLTLPEKALKTQYDALLFEMPSKKYAKKKTQFENCVLILILYINIFWDWFI